MERHLCWIAGMCLLVAGCGSPVERTRNDSLVQAKSVAPGEYDVGKVESEYDQFIGSQRDSVKVRSGLQDKNKPMTTVICARHRQGSEPADYTVTTAIRSQFGPLHPEECIWLADGQRIVTEVIRTQAGVTYSAYTDSSVFEISADQLRQLAAASAVSLRVYGSGGDGGEVSFTPGNIEALRKFVSLFVDR